MFALFVVYLRTQRVYAGLDLRSPASWTASHGISLWMGHTDGGWNTAYEAGEMVVQGSGEETWGKESIGETQT